MNQAPWLNGNAGDWFLRSLSYHTEHPVLKWATRGEAIRHGDIICIRGDSGSPKSLLLASAGGIGEECLLVLGNDSISPNLLKEQLLCRIKTVRGSLRSESAGKPEDFLLKCLAGLHVVSVASVDQLQQFVSSLPNLLSFGVLRNCRVVFFDDLDLGMVPGSAFGQQMARLTDVVRSLLQIAAERSLLFMYGLAKRPDPQIQTAARGAFIPNHPITGMNVPHHTLHSYTTLANEQAAANSADTAAAGQYGCSSTPCQDDFWRPPRRFVLQLLCDPQQANPSGCFPSRSISPFVCTSGTQESCVFAIGTDGECVLLQR
ncbi:hypothetical protein cyc_08042 [Cyclospora cayetanensis]|uniref:Uncharacterized protein n=1 Tax=Cyclospora cayetanensis TaxID=88456 RepID=A0A1D3CVG5_9EIME|nr:hypothetical protein cyc_08042 [Cyclospora cayetanensis]